MNQGALEKLLRDADPPVGGGAGGDDPAEVTPAVPRRSGSVQLRQVGATAAEDEQAMLDPANQSLAEALKVMMWLLRLAMVVLAGLYLASGFRSIKENERGIRLLFGKIQASNLPPGFAWSLPFPLGELRTVDKAYKALEINKDFWVAATGPETSVDKLTPTESLKPGQGGSVLLADGNIAHTRWRVGYSVEDVAAYSQNVLDERVEDLVRNAVKEGIVQACAEVTIEQLLTQSVDKLTSVRAKARQVAQETLDACHTGIKIDQLDPIDAIPPVKVRNDFERVQAASSNARRVVDGAKAEGERQLADVAGAAAPYLIREISRYEAAVKREEAAAARKDAAEQATAKAEMDRVLGRIEALMSGNEVEMDAGKVDFAGQLKELEGGRVSKLAGGNVAQRLAEANSYRSSAVSRAAGELNRFSAKLAQFNANSKFMVNNELVAALNDFMGRPTTQQIRIPNGLELVQIDTGPDPDFQRAIDKAKKEVERTAAEKEKMEKLAKEQFNTNTDLNVAPN
ncbi:MAG: SPFH domain-containing protein [Phycisphaerales bacterium]